MTKIIIRNKTMGQIWYRQPPELLPEVIVSHIIGKIDGSCIYQFTVTDMNNVEQEVNTAIDRIDMVLQQKINLLHAVKIVYQPQHTAKIFSNIEFYHDNLPLFQVYHPLLQSESRDCTVLVHIKTRKTD